MHFVHIQNVFYTLCSDYCSELLVLTSLVFPICNKTAADCFWCSIVYGLVGVKPAVGTL